LLGEISSARKEDKSISEKNRLNGRIKNTLLDNAEGRAAKLRKERSGRQLGGAPTWQVYKSACEKGIDAEQPIMSKINQTSHEKRGQKKKGCQKTGKQKEG